MSKDPRHEQLWQRITFSGWAGAKASFTICLSELIFESGKKIYLFFYKVVLSNKYYC
jgi:hypothetical protein